MFSGFVKPLHLEKSHGIICSIELMGCEDSLVLLTHCKFTKGAQPSAVFKREYCRSSVPQHHGGNRRKEETAILVKCQQRNFIISWRNLVMVSGLRFLLFSHTITHIWSHMSWQLLGENPPNSCAVKHFLQ